MILPGCLLKCGSYDISILKVWRCVLLRSAQRATGKGRESSIKLTLTVLLIASFFWDIGLIGFAFTRNDRRRAISFAMLAGTVLFYSVGYLVDIQTVTMGESIQALRIQNIGIPMIAPCFLLLTLAFFRPKAQRTWMVIAIAIYGASMFLATFTNPSHMLYYSSWELVFNGSYYIARLGKGPLYLVQQAVALACMGTAYSLLAVHFVRGSAKLRKEMKMFIIGSLFGFAANIANVLSIVPMGIDPMPFALNIGLIFFAVNLNRYKHMDVVPAAIGMAVENMDDAVIVLDTDWGFIYCNERAKELFPSLEAVYATEEIRRTANWPDELNPAAPSQVEFAMTHPATRQTIMQRARIESIHDARGNTMGTAITLHDITQITDMLNQLESLAITDSLTGIFNRRHFMQLVERHMSMAQRHDLPLSLLLLDIDHFKNINDTFSHQAGDKVLCHIVELLKKQLRTHDVLARYGGEEFVILSAEQSEEGLMSFAQRLRDAVEHGHIQIGDRQVRITVSFGVVLIQPGQTYKSAMAAADKALYAAKNAGRNCVMLGQIE